MKKYLAVILTVLAALALYDPELYAAGAQNIQAQWKYPNPPDGLAGFRLYVNQKAVQEIAMPAARSWSGPVMLEEGKNAFNLTAYDSDGHESEYSNTIEIDYNSITGNIPDLIKVKITVTVEAEK